MNSAQASKALEALEDAYWKGVEALAARVTHENIAPFCRKHGVAFSAGMGTWIFYGKAANDRYGAHRAWGLWDDSDLPAGLRNVLNAPVLSGQSLGSLCPSFVPDNFAPE